METPKTLLEAITYFSDRENCRKFMIALRWQDGVVRCPACGSDRVTYLANANVYKCKTVHPKQKFSLKTGTVFEDSPHWLREVASRRLDALKIARMASAAMSFTALSG